MDASPKSSLNKDLVIEMQSEVTLLANDIFYPFFLEIGASIRKRKKVSKKYSRFKEGDVIPWFL